MRKRKEGFSSSSSVARRVNEIKLLFFLKGEIILRANLRKRQQHNREKFFHQGRKRRKKTQKMMNF
jgi:hypothetical protein